MTFWNFIKNNPPTHSTQLKSVSISILNCLPFYLFNRNPYFIRKYSKKLIFRIKKGIGIHNKLVMDFQKIKTSPYKGSSNRYSQNSIIHPHRYSSNSIVHPKHSGTGTLEYLIHCDDDDNLLF